MDRRRGRRDLPCHQPVDGRGDRRGRRGITRRCAARDQRGDRGRAGLAIAREETFGPVPPVTPIRSEQEAIHLVNASEYGVLSAIFTQDLARGLRFAEAVRTGG